MGGMSVQKLGICTSSKNDFTSTPFEGHDMASRQYLQDVKYFITKVNLSFFRRIIRVIWVDAQSLLKKTKFNGQKSYDCLEFKLHLNYV